MNEIIERLERIERMLSTTHKRDKYLSRHEVIEVLGISDSSLTKRQKKDLTPHRYNGKHPQWIESEIIKMKFL
jgi:DNA-directed RNA polymerase specialized sigma subunit